MSKNSATSPGQLACQPRGGGERHRCRGPGGHLPQPRRHRLPGYPELGVARREPVTAISAVIPGPADAHPAQHRVRRLHPVGHKARLVPRGAPRAGPGTRHRRPASPPAAGHPAASARPGSPALPARCPPAGQRRGRLGRQPPHLGGCLRREPGGKLIAEPPFCPSGAGARPAAAGTGRTSQIASLTSAICSARSVNSW